MSSSPFPSLDGFEPTRQTLHQYARALGTIPRAHAVAHPKWWHISLKIRPEGLQTDNVPLPGGGILGLTLDLRQHAIVLRTSDGTQERFDLRAGRTGTEMGDALINAVARFGLAGPFARDKFESGAARTYDPDVAGRFFQAVCNAAVLFERHRAGLGGSVGPVQLWPHGFDLAFEWFGTREETYEENGHVTANPSQINLGLYPGSDGVAPYFYSNPWPFERDALLDKPLPAGARWHDEGWQGTILPYAELVADPTAGDRLLEFAQAVYDHASPLLLA